MERPRTWPALDLRARSDRLVPADVSDRLALLLDDLQATALEDDCRTGHWRVHFADATSRDTALASLRAAVGPWATVAAVDIEDEGWVTKVQADLRAVRVGRFVIAPPWDVPEPGAGAPPDIVIVIEPSMGFGTGHHQSTRLCLDLLQRLPLAGARVIDIGTGSGVLALAARRLGATDVQAIDHDPDSVEAARANATINGADPAVRIDQADISDASLAPAGFVIANLTAWLLRRYREPLAALVSAGGHLVTSGFTADQLPLVLDAFDGFAMVDTREEDDWLGVVFRRP